MQSAIFAISFGFFTLNPNLIFTLILAPTLLFNLKSLSKKDWLLLSFLFLWFLYAVFYGVTNKFNAFVKFDIRNLLNQFLFACTILGAFKVLNWEKFKELLVVGLRLSFLVLIISGLFEFTTGMHVVGSYTAKFDDARISNIFFAPTYIYDNPNNFVLYFNFFLMALIVFDDKIRRNIFLIILLAGLSYFFAFLASSKFGVIVSFCVLALAIILALLTNYRTIFRKKNVVYLAPIVIVLLVVLNNKLWLGSVYSPPDKFYLKEFTVVEKVDNKYRSLQLDEKYNKSELAQISDDLEEAKLNDPNNSGNIRKNLILNGFFAIKQAPILGVGPGQYAELTSEDKFPNYVKTVNSSHNFPIEIVSQYGIFGWIYFIFLFGIFISILLLKSIERELKICVLLFIALQSIFWMMPSAYLLLDIEWMLLPLLLCFLAHYQSLKPANGKG